MLRFSHSKYLQFVIIFLQMKADDILTMRWGVEPIPFSVEVSWTDGDQPPRKLKYATEIDGATNHQMTIVSPDLTGI